MSDEQNPDQTTTGEAEPPLSLKRLKGMMDASQEATSANMLILADQADAQADKLDQVLEALKGMTAKDRPSIGEPGRVEPMEMHTGDGQVFTDSDIIDRPALVEVSSPIFKKKAELEDFMREKVKIKILDTGGRDDDMCFGITVNGRERVFHRGEIAIVPRYYVEGLARAKPVHFDNEMYKNARGEDAYRYPRRASLRYPFAVLEDRNPRGEAWLEGVVKQP